MKVKLNQRVVALGAAGLVLLSGATVTSLAAWTDTEWVNGGVSNTPAVTSSMFDVQQNVTSDPTTGWTTDLASPGGIVNFGTEAAELSPGTSVVGFVRLRVAANSTGGTITLEPGTSTGSTEFLNDLQFGAWLHPDASTCTTSDYNGTGFTPLVADGSALTTARTSFTLQPGSGGAAGAEQTVCFRLTMPALVTPGDKSLEGLTADPIWQFDGVSD